jgi:ABC-type antimicrobial peptide transport system permease subunit
MIKNYLKIAWRNLIRNKSFSIINILGLAIGMASAILIMLWIMHEISYDRFHAKKDRIYEAWNRSKRNGIVQSWSTTPKVLARTIKKDFPEIDITTRVNWNSTYLFSIGDKRLTSQGIIVDSTFLQVFSFPLVKGKPGTALMQPNTIVLSEKLAKKLFGSDDALGKTLMLENKDLFTVSGIIKDPPANTRFQFEYLIPWSYLRKQGGDDEYWGNNSTRTYVLLRPNAKLASINAKMINLREHYDKEDPSGGFFLYPIERWHLYSNFENGRETSGLIDLVRMFAIIAAFILMIACINFMNLSTARSEKRSREVGIRKVAGALRRSLVIQFLGESIMISFIAALLAILIVQLSLPAFNELTGKQLAMPFGEPYFWFIMTAFVVFTGIIAGSYPAFFLSSFKPVRVLKGLFSPAKTLIAPRKVLVVSQFTFAIVLIVGTIIIRKQIQHAQERQTGYNKNNLVCTFLTGDIEKNYALIKNELISAGIATSVTKTSAPLTEGWSNTWGLTWEGKDPNDKTIFDRYIADDGIVATAGMELVMGRDFDLDTYPTDSTAVIINESALKHMKLRQPIGAIVNDNGIDWHVVGVIKDFVLQSPYAPTNPMFILGAKSWFATIHVRFNNARSTAGNLAAMQKIFKKYNPEFPFDYRFIDEEYARKFSDEKRQAKLASIFAILSIFISCLGLFGLAAYMAEARIKEIGIRKVLGASVSNITTLLSKDFLKLVLIALIIATPLAWYFMDKWLSDFDYRITISWWTFIIAGALALLIALLTVCYQAIKAALRNPVKSLRSE